jgi:flagellar hook-associated protein 3 FlgL
MRRISSFMTHDDMQYAMLRRQWEMNKAQNAVADQTRIRNLRDDPIAAAHSTRYKSKVARLERFNTNIETVLHSNAMAEGRMNSALSILHRVRELGVQGANGTYSTEERRYMAIEIDQLLRQMVEEANAVSSDGNAIFAGDKLQSTAFRALESSVDGSNVKLITDVRYVGSNVTTEAEIADGNYLVKNFPGSEVFWAENQQVIAGVNAQDFIASQDSAIFLDGHRIEIAAGDNVSAVIAKINDSGAAVRASLDPVFNSLTISGTNAHQIWMEDEGAGTVLQDLGLIDGDFRPPGNFAPDARVSGGSMFDTVIRIRDALYDGDTLDIGGGALKGIDLAMDNFLSRLAALGARDERMEITLATNRADIPEIRERDAVETGIDLAQAITELKMLEYNHQAALQTAGRILGRTLLDFLR